MKQDTRIVLNTVSFVAFLISFQTCCYLVDHHFDSGIAKTAGYVYQVLTTAEIGVLVVLFFVYFIRHSLLQRWTQPFFQRMKQIEELFVALVRTPNRTDSQNRLLGDVIKAIALQVAFGFLGVLILFSQLGKF